MRRFSPAALLVLGGFAWLLNAQRRPDVMGQEKAAALGARLATQARSRTEPIRIAAVDRYLAALGQRLTAGFPNGPPHWEFTVVKQRGDWTHEALALLGGHVFVLASLIVLAGNEGEVAAILAHSMAKAV